jgi:transcription elongation factor Elf1
MNSIEIKEFQYNFVKNLELDFELDESKQNELFAIAKNKGIIAEGSRDLALFSGTLEMLDKANGNNKILPKSEALKKLPQLCGKPLNLNHLRKMVVGAIIDFRYVEKENKIVIYGCIYKSIWAEEYEKMKQAFKSKKLALSSEIWSPKSQRKFNTDGSFELKNIEFAGAAIIIMDNKTKPAEDECRILELSTKKYEEYENLIYSSLNKEKLDEASKEVNEGDLLISEMEMAPVQNQPNKLKLVCPGCGTNFEYLFIPNQVAQIKCPQCESILDQQGKLLYPSQKRNFEISCPNCSSSNWLILESNDDNAKIRCNSCQKEYDLTFKKMNPDIQTMLSKIDFLSMGSVRCHQCGTYNSYAVPSRQDKISLTCSKCGLPYSFTMSKKIKKDISKIEEIIHKEDKKEESNKMFSLIESNLEISEAELNDFENYSMESMALEESKKLSYAEEKNLKDENFAVVIKLKDKEGKAKILRKYPISGTSDDQTRVRAALRYLGVQKNQDELKKYKVGVQTVIDKVLARAKELGMKDLIERHKSQMGEPKTNEERAQNHFGISLDEWNKLSNDKKADYISKLPKRGYGMEKSELNKLLRKAGKKIMDSKKCAKKSKDEADMAKSKLDKFVGGVKRLATKIRDLKTKVSEKDLEVSNLKVELEKTKEVKPQEEPIKSQKEEPKLETASLNVGDIDKGRNERVEKIRAQADAYLNPKK